MLSEATAACPSYGGRKSPALSTAPTAPTLLQSDIIEAELDTSFWMFLLNDVTNDFLNE
jgi:hypothetical protein